MPPGSKASPKIDHKAGAWAIEARAFHIGYTPFTHNFWVLADAGGKPVDQIHGLAIDRESGHSKAIGNSHDLLQAVRDAAIDWSLQPGQPVVVCATGPPEEINLRWQAALRAIPAINALALPYPNLWQHFHKRNSNTVFNTIGLIMGFATPALLLATWAPGVELVISKKIIKEYCYKPPV